MRSKIAVLIPCYNESKTIEKVVKDYKAALPEADIFVYDNNSTDGTDEIARNAGAIVRYETKQGKGNVMRTMFRNIEADCYLIVDGDDTYPAENAREMCDLVLKENVDMVIGDRLSSTYFKENKRAFHNAIILKNAPGLYSLNNVAIVFITLAPSLYVFNLDVLPCGLSLYLTGISLKVKFLSIA